MSKDDLTPVLQLAFGRTRGEEEKVSEAIKTLDKSVKAR